MTQEQFPQIANSDIESAAEALLRGFFASIGQPVRVPVPIESIAEQYLGYRIEITNDGLFQDPSFLGGVDFQSHTIFVNTSVEGHDGRYAFTVAHELGHHALHRERSVAGATSGETQIMCRSSAKRPVVEYQADRFAAAFLMPAEVLRQAINAVTKRMPRIHSTSFLASRLISEGGFSNVSHEAMRLRLRELKLSPRRPHVPRGLLAISRSLYRLLRYVLRRH